MRDNDEVDKVLRKRYDEYLVKVDKVKETEEGIIDEERTFTKLYEWLTKEEN